MDIGALALEVAVSVVSASAVVAATAWKLGRDIQKIKDTATNAVEAAARAEKKADKAETSIDALAKEENESWQELNRTLGQIEGAMGITPRPKMKSRP